MQKILCYCQVIVALMMMSCERFLDEKMVKSLTVPTTTQDLEALLKATGKINISVMPSLLEIGADDYRVNESGFNNLTEFERRTYTWAVDMDYQLVNMANEWSKSYEIVLIANTVLEYLPKVEGTAIDKKRLRGEALFIRSWCFYNLAQVYCSVYIPNSDNAGLGIPLRVHSDLNVGSSRATVAETYAMIVSDLLEATTLLSTDRTHVTRPDRTASLALLARAYLAMSDYDNALRFSREALQAKDDLMDYNSIKVNDRIPFERFNKEVLYHSTTAFMQVLNPTISYVDPELIGLYKDGDLRKSAFFTLAKEGYFTFKGSYDGTISGSHFVGLTTAELYLILAETLVRGNKVKEGVDVLNNLLKKRCDKNSFIPLSIHDKDEALKEILDERRKELVFRGVRWTDIRRLNLDGRFARTLTRTVAGETFILPPNDPRFVYLIPQDVIHFSGMAQNKR